MRKSANQLKGRKGLIVVEIGVFRGGNALDMVKHLDIKRIYLIDPYRPYSEDSTNPKDWEEILTAKHVARKKLSAFTGKCEWIEKKLSEAIDHIPMADYIYIDGGHDYEVVRGDIKLYLEKVKQGGILAGHDYPNKPGVKRAVDELMKTEKVHVKKPDWWLHVK